MTFVASVTKQKFLASEEAAWAREELGRMVSDSHYNTPARPFYIHSETGVMSFVEQHLTYLSEHPQIKVQEYLSNLRLKTKKWN